MINRNVRILYSWWILLTFTLGFLNWVAFLYIGITARQKKWIIWGLIYAIPITLGMLLFNTEMYKAWFGNVFVFLFLVTGIISIIHAFKVRGEYLNIIIERKKIKSQEIISNDIQISNNSKIRNNYLRFLGISIGVIIILVSELVIQKGPERIILDIIGGFIASSIAGGTIKNGVVNGAIVGILGGAVAAIYIGFGGETDIASITGSITGYSLAIMIFGLIGGLIGILSRKLVSTVIERYL